METLEKGVKTVISYQYRHHYWPQYVTDSLAGVFIVNFEHISHIFLLLLLLTLNKYMLAGRVITQLSLQWTMF